MSAAFRSASPDRAVPKVGGELIPATTTQTKRLALLRGPDRWWKNPHVRAYSYPGRLDVPRLEQALRLVARRHSGLRVHFHPDDPIDSARCLPPDEATWPFREMTAGSDPAAADAEAYTWLARQFSPYERPLYRALVLHRPETDMFGLSIEQSILDHAGAMALFDDITQVYDGLADRSASAFDELVSDATRFARAERAWFAGEDAAKALAWWDEYNEGLGPYPGLDLPELGTVDTWGPIVNYDLRLSVADTTQLKQHARRQRLTPTMLASAATAVTLRAHGHPGDVRFLFATSRRVLPGTEKVIGYFSNRMMLRIPVTPRDTVSSLAPKMRAGVLDAVAHSMYSHEEYVRTRYPDAYDRQPTCYGYLNTAAYAPPPRLDGLPLARESVPMHGRDFHQPGLALALLLYDEGLAVVNATCAAGMYTREFVERITQDLARVCVGATPG